MKSHPRYSIPFTRVSSDPMACVNCRLHRDTHVNERCVTQATWWKESDVFQKIRDILIENSMKAIP
jgi:hypothetical protein